ncbi:hypothetical protein [Haloplasma contractile]|uniref:Uncharacterized protein n=1 Tax=Haloplasma contractile SSD-17B TaxID=1033810 RepID=F7PVI8_9MOLU|nr:hypothetical protein [Haloplasma contractile]ERJ12844.1 hypothetical protein HLPCO_001184 [Haloplasma contractile SSD-17B]
MRLIKRLLVLSVLCLIGILVTFINEPLIIKGNTFNNTSEQDEQARIFSQYIFNTSEVKFNDKSYTAVLKRDAIYFVNNQGIATSQLIYPDTVNKILQSKLIPKSISDSGFIDERTLDFEIRQIPDIDQQGSKDLLLMIRSRNVKEFNYLIAISYESSNVIWEYQPRMKSTKICGFKTFCEEPVEIMEMKIRNNALYLASGYHLSMLNLESGKLLKEFEYDNNVWTFDFISDINHDGTDDLAVAVQPSKVLSIDGETFSELNQLNVATDITLSDFITLKVNVTKLAYLQSRNVLVAASEDGNIYELDMEKGLIINQTTIFSKDDLASYYPDIRRERERDEFEYFREETIDYFVLGDHTPIKFDIVTFKSIDTDDIEDYLVEWKWSVNKNGEFNSVAVSSSDHKLRHFRIERSNASSLKFEKSRFRFIYNNMLFYTKSGYLDVIDLPDNSHVVNSNYPVQSNSLIMPISDGMLIKHPNQMLTYYDLETFPKLDTIWYYNQPSNPISNQEVLRGKDYFLTLHRTVDPKQHSDSLTDRVKLYNKDHELIKEYETEPGTLIEYKYITDNEYYFIEKTSDNQILTKTFDAKTGELTALRTPAFNKIYDFDFEMEESHFTSHRMHSIRYRDLNQDGVDEVLVIKYDLNFRQFDLISSYYIYDLVNNSVIDNYYEYDDDYIWIDDQPKFFSVEEDVNQDGLPDLLVYKFSTHNTLDVKVLYSKVGDLLNEENVVTKSFNIPNASYRIVREVDLNNDGFKEIILNMIGGLSSTFKQAAYIVDYKQNKFIKFADYVNDAYHIEDIDHDGTKEIVAVKTNREYSEIISYGYRAGQVSSQSIRVLEGRLVAKASEVYTLFDYNKDGVKDVIVSSFDQQNTIQIEIVDYKTGQLIKNHTYHLHNKKVDVGMGEKQYYSKTTVGTFNNKPYLMVTLPSHEQIDFSKYETLYDQSELLLIKPTSLKLDYYIGDYEMLFNKNLLFRVKNHIYMNHLIDYQDIKTQMTGLFNNYYQFNVDTNTDIKQVQVMIHDKLYNSVSILDFNNDEFEINLSTGEYDLRFYIYTNEGHVYQYHDQVFLHSSQSKSIVYQGIVILIFTTLFVASSIKIKRVLHH